MTHRQLWMQHLDPIRHWYDNRPEMTEEEIVKQVVEDLQGCKHVLGFAQHELIAVQEKYCDALGIEQSANCIAMMIEDTLERKFQQNRTDRDAK